MLEKINFELTCLGYTKKDNWECIKFNCKINGYDFEYSVGLGHTKQIEDTKSLPGTNFSPFEIKKIRDQGYTIKASKIVQGKNIVGGIKDFSVNILVKPPKLKEILHCLFLDSEASDECFEDWAINFGYDSDSIKAKKVYDSCIESYHKLKKALGPNYNEIKDFIQKLEL
jgi:hypothetical protein